jgi:dihydrofolate reductase
VRRIIYGAACSLDGFIATEDHGVDWLRWSDDVAAITEATLRGVDTIIMGRRTYEVAVRSGTRVYPGYRNCVFSRTLPREAAAEVEVITEDAAVAVRRMKQAEGGGICVMGGGELASTLLDAGLIDEVGLNIHPVLLGRGVPMFPRRDARIDLELVEARPIAQGCVYALYRVKSAARG